MFLKYGKYFGEYCEIQSNGGRYNEKRAVPSISHEARRIQEQRQIHSNLLFVYLFLCDLRVLREIYLSLETAPFT
jgi:hypothetical protein